MKGIKFLVTILLIVHKFNNIESANGCGSSFNINGLLKTVGEAVIIPCCNQHDYCYERCGKTKTSCDNAFHSCMRNACDNQNKSISIKKLCNVDADALHRIVTLFGSGAYNRAQKQFCQSKKG